MSRYDSKTTVLYEYLWDRVIDIYCDNLSPQKYAYAQRVKRYLLCTQVMLFRRLLDVW